MLLFSPLELRKGALKEQKMLLLVVSKASKESCLHPHERLVLVRPQNSFSQRRDELDDLGRLGH